MKKSFTKELLYVGLMISVLAAFYVIKPISINIVKGDSMEPTLHSSDIKITTSLRKPKIGDIVTVKEARDNEDIIVVKRLLAKGGDTVAIKEKVLYVNDVRVIDISDKFINIPDLSIQVEDGYMFIMGDNVGRSNDSLYKLLSNQFKNKFLYEESKLVSSVESDSKNEEINEFVMKARKLF